VAEAGRIHIVRGTGRRGPAPLVGEHFTEVDIERTSTFLPKQLERNDTIEALKKQA